MKIKDLAFLVTVITAILGLLGLLGGMTLPCVPWLGYAWASYYRYKDNENAKRITIIISILMIFAYVANYTDEKSIDLIAWIILVIIDYKLLNKKIV